MNLMNERRLIGRMPVVDLSIPADAGSLQAISAEGRSACPELPFRAAWIGKPPSTLRSVGIQVAEFD
jgi:hypothetical protein